MPGKGRPPQAIPSPISRHIITCYVRYQGSKHTVIYILVQTIMSVQAKLEVVRRKHIVHLTSFGAYSSTCYKGTDNDINLMIPIESFVPWIRTKDNVTTTRKIELRQYFCMRRLWARIQRLPHTNFLRMIYKDLLLFHDQGHGTWAGRVKAFLLNIISQMRTWNIQAPRSSIYFCGNFTNLVWTIPT